MVVPNRISVELSQQDLDDINANVESIRAILPFLIGLSAKERMGLSAVGDASVGFMRRCMDVAPLVVDYLPRGLDVDEMRKDIELMDTLTSIEVVLSKLLEEVVDTRSLVSSEAFAAAREVYRAAKKAQSRQGMDEVVNELSRRFARTKSAQSAESDDTPAPVTDAATDG